MTTEDLVAFVKKNLISVACAVFTILIAALCYYRSDLLPEAQKVLDERSAKAALIAANIEDSAQLREQHARLVAANKLIADRMIHVGQLAENTGYFYRLESETGVHISDPKQSSWNPPGKGAPKTNYTWVGFSVSATGDYNQVLDFLLKLESGEHFCRVNSLLLRPVSEMRGGPMNINVSLELMAAME
jgi:hypothetical protein